jgi:hypothetical protein
MVMVELLSPLANALEKIEDWNDKESASGAHLLLNSIKSASFVLALFTIEKLYSYTLPLSKMLQMVSLDLVSAIEMAENVVSELENIRKSPEEVFSQIFRKSSTVLQERNDEQFKRATSRLAGRQTNRTNVKTKTPEAYFRISIFIQFLDSMISQLKERFIKHKNVLQSLNILIPGRNQNGFESQLEILLSLYSFDLEGCNLNILTAEYQLWQRKFTTLEKSTIPNSAIQAIQMCNPNLFPNIYKLLKILVTLPVTTCTTERSFSTLKYLKSYLRNSTSQERLNGLAMLFIHKNIQVTEDEVLNVLQKKKRKINILF